MKKELYAGILDYEMKEPLMVLENNLCIYRLNGENYEPIKSRSRFSCLVHHRGL